MFRELAHIQTLYKRMTLKQVVEALLDRPEVDGWNVEIAADINPAVMKEYMSPSASIEHILEELAQYYAAKLVIDYQTKTVRFVADLMFKPMR